MQTRRKRIFYPGHPVPPAVFVGRKNEIEHLMEHGLAPAIDGHPRAMFILGEYGMGKTSIARLLKSRAEDDHDVYGIYASLGGATTLQELTRSIFSAIEDSQLAVNGAEALAGAADAELSLLTADGFPVHAGQENLGLGASDEAAAKSSKAEIALLGYLKRLRLTLFAGTHHPILLILDEIDTLAPNPLFAPFVKGFIDTNAQDRDQVPLLLIVCGVRRCWRQMVDAHEPIERVFDPVEISPMSYAEALEFYREAFSKASMGISEGAVREFYHQSAGIPRLMHLVGDTAYRAARNHRINLSDARAATALAARDYGNRFVREKLAPVLLTGDEKSILYQLGRLDSQSPSFAIGQVAGGLSVSELPKLSGFLGELVRIGILRSGETRDQFEFCIPLVQQYISLVERNRRTMRL